MPLVDYHTHTKFSDGSDTPETLLAKAKSKGLAEVAITDHDTIAGLSMDLIRHSPVKLIPGVELSADWGPGTMHIVGLNIDISNQTLRENLSLLSRERKRRTPKIIKALSEMGITLTESEVNEKAGSGSVSRNHIASLIADKGHAENRTAAFEKYLKKGGPAYVPKVRLKPMDCIKVLKGCGAMVILAHPVQLKVDGIEFRSLLTELIAAGLDGLETKSSHHAEADQKLYEKFAGEFNLVQSAGSDYHGAVKPAIALGIESEILAF
jgi:predicted metal-dependent phosphoesterase TrpH